MAYKDPEAERLYQLNYRQIHAARLKIAQAIYYQAHKPEPSGAPHDPPVACVCAFCQSPFMRPAAWVRKGRGRFCSMDCKIASQRTPITLICELCQNPFTTIPAYQRKGNVRFCSRECAKLSKQLPLEERFWAKVVKTDTCWLWKGAKHKQGYGIILAHAKPSPSLLTHRVAWEIGHSPIPEDLEVLHHCDNPPCVNYEQHLFLGTPADNFADMRAKERGVGQKNAPSAQGPRSSHVE
jgi:hypothetical protein